jgi:hypothetical protein
MHSSNPGSTDIFGCPAGAKNKGFPCKCYWLDYKIQGTPLHMHVGFDLWRVDQTDLLGNNDPRFALFGDFGDFDVMAAVVRRASQRLGLTNENDFLYSCS